MNIAHGTPDEDMPFDMRHLRWPLTYNLPDGADEGTRRTEREKLAKALAEAIRAVLKSEDYRASLPKAAAPTPFPATVMKNGPARFRASNEPLGIDDNTFPFGLHVPNKEIRLKDGPAIWLRLMPTVSPGCTWSLSELKQAATRNGTILLPLRREYTNYGYLRAEDGFGVYAAHGDGQETCSAVFAFTNGEVWTADSCLISQTLEFCGNTRRPGLSTMEDAFKAALAQYDKFLQRLGLKRPFRWIGGYEGIKGMGLFFDPPPGHHFRLPGPFGSSVANLMESEGLLEEGASPAQALKPLFTKLFDVCDLKRGDYLDDIHNP